MRARHPALCSPGVLLLLLAACGSDGTSSPETVADAASDTVGSDDTIDHSDGSGGGDADGSSATAAVCGDGTCAPAETEDDCPDDCGAAPTLRYTLDGSDIFAFPDDSLTVADATTATGLRIALTPDRSNYVANIPRSFRTMFAQLSTLDGFGTTAGGFFRFSHAIDPNSVPTGDGSAQAGASLLLGCLQERGGPAPAFVAQDIETIITEDGSVIFRPMQPLPEESQCVALFTNALRDAEGRAARPNRLMRAILDGSAGADEPTSAPQTRAMVSAAAAAGLVEQASVAGAVSFTTQSISRQAREIAAGIATRNHAQTGNLGCTEAARYRRCTVTFTADDFRGADKIIPEEVGASALGTYEMKAVIYLPLAETGAVAPFPTLIFGHGLNGDRQQAGRLADFAAPLGIATISIDAPAHGEHPRTTGSPDAAFIEFFGLGAAGFEPLVLRDHWRQAAYDKLALLSAIGSGIDADGDGVTDLSDRQIGYLGVSLGGIMGPEFLALTDRVPAAVLVVGGGRVTDILQFSSTFGPLVSLLKPSGFSDDDVARFWPLAQTAIDRGDAASFARAVSVARLDGSPPVQVLNAHVLDDDIVPNVSNFALARALELPHLGPVLRPIGALPTGETLPANGNLALGVTGGTIQFDWVNEGTAELPDWRTATHNNIGDSTEGAHAWLRFIRTWLDTGTGTIVDAYEDLGETPPR